MKIRSMLSRLCNPLISNSFLLFGARGTRKSTLVKALLRPLNPLIINLLEAAQIESALFALPELEARIEAAVERGRWIFIDAIQKAPRLLDVAHRLIKDIPGSHIVVLSRDTEAKQYEAMRCMHWSEGLTEIFEARS